ncbi:hypothetical protein GTP41_05690 [Pseudoduganella sp. DS3]|uniref:Uncharacterized protein n=1 Tax=Pseudoduganella guangdongensis TaxID=2692179 RepID=A0A6N9HDQ9_9BURK|nr:hypothetical protein [Pseudoduganella guangdongensis]MYN01586.1 hypothetical protein [Pseudoduganella guangdongensis]
MRKLGNKRARTNVRPHNQETTTMHKIAVTIAVLAIGTRRHNVLAP